MKTRWGVCNRGNNTITLNSLLIRYEKDIIDYVIYHELSHFIAITESPEASYNSSKLHHNEKDIKTVKKVSK